MTNFASMILYKKYFSIPFQRLTYQQEKDLTEGDVIIQIPELTVGQSKYAIIEEFGHILHDEEGIHLGHIEITSIECICKEGKALYFELHKPKEIIYKISFYVYDIEDYVVKQFNVTNLAFFCNTIIPYINLLIDEGHQLKDFNWEWIEWQSTTWNSSEANGQGRTFTYYENDIYSLDKYYDYLKSFRIKVFSKTVAHRGGGSKWQVIIVKFDFIDNYISNIIADSLGVGIITEDSSVAYRIETNHDYVEGFCPTAEIELSVEESEKYREFVFKKLIVGGAFCRFNLETMKKLRFIIS